MTRPSVAVTIIVMSIAIIAVIAISRGHDSVRHTLYWVATDALLIRFEIVEKSTPCSNTRSRFVLSDVARKVTTFPFTDSTTSFSVVLIPVVSGRLRAVSMTEAGADRYDKAKTEAMPFWTLPTIALASAV